MLNADVGNSHLGSSPNSVDASNVERQGVVRQELVSCYARYRSMAIRRLGDRAAADDVVQAFALKAFERSSQLRSLNAVHGWLHCLFETTLIDFYRRRSAILAREIANQDDTDDRAPNVWSYQGPALEQVIAGLLKGIKREYADVIIRLDLSNQSNEDVAGQLGITVNNLTVRAHRARRALRTAMEAAPMLSYG